MLYSRSYHWLGFDGRNVETWFWYSQTVEYDREYQTQDGMCCGFDLALCFALPTVFVFVFFSLSLSLRLVLTAELNPGSSPAELALPL